MQTQKIGYILLLVISATVSLQAQKFVNLENRWRIVASNWGFIHPYLTFFKDSIEIEGKYYYQRYTSIDSSLQVIDATGEYYREEAGVVYYYGSYLNPNFPKELVMYNFNLNVGDSISFSYYRLKVINIDSITLLDGSKRKRWEFSSNRRFISSKIYWVEGIGSLSLQTLRPDLATLIDSGNDFSCYFHKGELLYSSPSHPGNNAGQSCATRLGADPVSTRDLQELKSLEVLQNLGDGELIFHLNESGNYQTRLFNAVGALLEQKAVSQGTNRLTLAALPRVIYFLQVIDLNNFRQKTLKLTRQ